jgi:transposase
MPRGAAHGRGRCKPEQLILEGLPADRVKAVRQRVARLQGNLMLRFLPGYGSDLNPEEKDCLYR